MNARTRYYVALAIVWTAVIAVVTAGVVAHASQYGWGETLSGAGVLIGAAIGFGALLWACNWIANALEGGRPK